MSSARRKLLARIIGVMTVLALQTAWAHDIRITIPRRSELTPVQRLNRKGVEAVQKHQYEKAEAIFYKAYLYDPADPFTLNNLGYISELQGDLDRAQSFYALAAKQGCSAVVDVSSEKQLKGKPMTYALNNIEDTPMRVDRMNIAAIELLSQGRNFEADRLLRQALKLEPQDPFTLNNLAVADEATGDFQDALKFYTQAANLQSSEPIVVSARKSWRGEPVSKAAEESARQLQKKMQNLEPAQTQAMMFTFQGVAAVNRNDWNAAKQDFLRAYALDPNDPFTLNNVGYVAEKNGDIETAQFFYSRARAAGGSDVRVGLATRSGAEGQPLFAVAADSDHAIDHVLAQYQRTRRQETGPIELIPRGSPSPSNPQPSGSQPPQ
jgi:Flp pilus assembly protein TadD